MNTPRCSAAPIPPAPTAEAMEELPDGRMIRRVDIELISACSAGLPDEALRLLKLGASPLESDHNLRTAAMAAAIAGSEQCAAILAPLSDLEALDMAGMSALRLAAWHGRAKCVATLLPWCDPNAGPDAGSTALMEAARQGRAGCARLLLPVTEFDPSLGSDIGGAQFPRGIGKMFAAEARRRAAEREAAQIAASLAPASEAPKAAPKRSL